jgi:hypothetical protein
MSPVLAQSGHPARSDPRPLSGEQRTSRPAQFPWDVVLRGSARQQPTRICRIIAGENPTGDADMIYLAAVRNSLILSKKSLFFKIFSLLICVGNYWRSGCSAAVSCIEIGSQRPKFAKFPVKFPDSREFAWRRVRSALRRQPGSPALGETVPDTRRKARQWRAFANWPPVSGLRFWAFSDRNSQ